MDSKYLQQQRFQLQKRFRRMNSCSHLVFHSSMVQLWKYIHQAPLLQGILHRLAAETPTHEEEVTALFQGVVHQFDTEQGHTGFIFRVLEHCGTQPLGGNDFGPEMKIGRNFASELDESLDEFREMLLEPFYEYLDEALDSQMAVLSLLVKYKRKVEWFEREALAELAKGDERALAKHLYAYLFEQGLEFHIEPQSASGEADLVAPELVLDAKVFDAARRNLTYITHGVNQLYAYASDFNQTVGYLVVYKTCSEALHFSVRSADDLVPHVNAAGKTLYLLVIDICQYDTSASKRGVFKTFTLDEAALVRAASERISEATDTVADLTIVSPK